MANLINNIQIGKKKKNNNKLLNNNLINSNNYGVDWEQLEPNNPNNILNFKYKERNEIPVFNEELYNEMINNEVLKGIVPPLEPMSYAIKPPELKTRIEYNNNNPLIYNYVNDKNNSLQTIDNIPTIYSNKEIEDNNKLIDKNKELLPTISAMSMWDKLDDDRKQQMLIGLTGAGIQGVSAIADLINNTQQGDVPRPSHIITPRIGYKPVDTAPYERKIEQSVSGYKKYLMETGNANMLPAVVGDAMNKENEMFGQVTQQNNQGRMQVDQFNTQTQAQTDAQNASMDANWQQLNLANKQYQDQSIRSNKNTFFNSLALGANTLAGNSSQKLKLDTLKQLIDSGKFNQFWRAVQLDPKIALNVGLTPEEVKTYADENSYKLIKE